MGKPIQVDPDYQIDINSKQVSIVIAFNPQTTNSAARQALMSDITEVLDRFLKKNSKSCGTYRRQRNRRRNKMGFAVELKRRTKGKKVADADSPVNSS